MSAPSYETLKEQADFIRAQPVDKIPELISYALLNWQLVGDDAEAFYALCAGHDFGTGQYDDALITKDWLKQYARYRSIGMSITDAGRALGLVPERMRRIVSGERIKSLQVYERIVEVEVKSSIHTKLQALEAVDMALASGDSGTALKVLEKRYSKEWSPEPAVVVNNNVATNKVELTSENCESLASAAAERLLELRKARKERNSRERNKERKQ